MPQFDEYDPEQWKHQKLQNINVFLESCVTKWQNPFFKKGQRGVSWPKIWGGNFFLRTKGSFFVAGILRSGTSFCVTRARLSKLFHPCSRRSTSCMLLKCWQAWVELRGGCGCPHFVAGTFCFSIFLQTPMMIWMKGWKRSFCEVITVAFGFGAWW